MYLQVMSMNNWTMNISIFLYWKTKLFLVILSTEFHNFIHLEYLQKKHSTLHFLYLHVTPHPPSHHFSRKIHVIIFEIVFVLFFWNIFWIFLFLLFSLDSNLLDVLEETIWKYKHKVYRINWKVCWQDKKIKPGQINR